MTISSFFNLTFARKANKHTDYIIPGIQQKKPSRIILKVFCGAYETRTRDLLRDRQAF